MKELSIEQKARRYDEAIELAKDSYNYPSYPGFIRVDVVFPELKESEDEKTRKSITEFFKNFSKTGTWNAIPNVAKWIEWLEKEGEQKSVKCIKDEALSKLLNKVICRFINNPDIPYSERDEVSVKLIPYVEMLEKQGEKESDTRYKYLEELLAADNIYQMAMNSDMIQEAKTKAINALSKLEIGKWATLT